MTDIAAINHASASRIREAGSDDRGVRRPSAEPGSPARARDRVEVSDMALLMARLKNLPPVRQELIDRVRGEIAAGTYDTPEKFEAALDGLVRDAGA